MASIDEHIDLGSTLANFSERKGEFPYKKDQMLTNSLKSIPDITPKRRGKPDPHRSLY